MNNNVKLLVSGVVASVAIAGLVWQYGPCAFPAIPSSSPPIPNAYNYFSKAATGLRRDEQKVKLPSTIIREDYDNYPPALQSAVLQAVAPDLETIRTGLTFSYGYPEDRANPQMVVYPEYREMVRLLRLQGLVDARHGDWNGAANSYIDCVQLGVAVPHGSPAIGGILGTVLETIGRNKLWAVISNLSYSQAQSAKLRLLKIEAQRQPYLDGQVEQLYSQQALLRSYFKSSGWAKEVAYSEVDYLDGPQRPNDNELQALMWRLNFEGKRALYNQTTDYQYAVIDAARKPYSASASSIDLPMDPITAFYYPRLDPSMHSLIQFSRVRYVDGQTQNNLLIVTLALRQYWLKNHAYPKSQAELTPEYLSAVPPDPFAPLQPLHYKRIGNSYRLYSVGPDGIDNNGSPIAMGAAYDAYLQDTSTGDIVAGINP